MKRGLWRLLRSTDLWVLLGYLGLTLLFTYPLVLHFTTHVPGDGRDDPALVWNLWWVKHALLDLHVNPLTTDFLFYPIGVNLSFYTLTLLNGVVSIPLQALFGLVAASNLLLLLSFVLSGYSTYLLVLYLLNGKRNTQHVTRNTQHATRNTFSVPLVAFIAGIVYAFAACKLWYVALGQFNIASSQWIPFYVLFLLKMTERTPTHSYLKGQFFENGGSDLTPWPPSLRGKGKMVFPLRVGRSWGRGRRNPAFHIQALRYATTL